MLGGVDTFYQRRFVVEMIETDEEAFATLAENEKRVKQLNYLSSLCRVKFGGFSTNPPYFNPPLFLPAIIKPAESTFEAMKMKIMTFDM